VATLALREQTSNHPRTDQERSSFGSIKPSTEPRHGCEANWGKEQDENLSSLGPIVDGSEIQLSGQFSIVLSGSLAKNVWRVLYMQGGADFLPSTAAVVTYRIITCSVGNLYYISFLNLACQNHPKDHIPPRKTQQKRCDTLFPTLPSFTVNKNQQIGNLIIPTSPVGFTQRVSTQLLLVVS